MNVGIEYQLGQPDADGQLRAQQPAPDDRGHLGVLDNGDEVYMYVNPGEGIAATMVPSGLHRRRLPTPKPKRQYDALEVSRQNRFSNNWFWSASYVLQPALWQLRGPRHSRRNHDADDRSWLGTAQQQAGSIARPGGNANRAWDLDELVWDATATSTCSAAWRRIVRTS